jgi:hypothetical protein
MESVEYLQKDGKVSFNSTKYNYLSEEKITNEIRKALLRAGLVILPVGSKTIKEGSLTQVCMTYKIVEADTGIFELLEVTGQGADSQDKGIAKAQTMAYKYALRQTFAVPTGDDPDKISSEELDEQQEKQEEEKIIKVDEEQIKNILRLANSRGVNDGQLMTGIKKQYGKQLFELNLDEYMEMISKLQQMKKENNYAE